MAVYSHKNSNSLTMCLICIEVRQTLAYTHCHSKQWIQDPSQSNVDNLNNLRREFTRHFRNKKKAYLRAKIEELETNSKIQNIRHLYRGIKRGTSLAVI